MSEHHEDKDRTTGKLELTKAMKEELGLQLAWRENYESRGEIEPSSPFKL